MAFAKYSGVDHYTGLSTDTKPASVTGNTIKLGSTFIEEDTGHKYQYGATGWFFAGVAIIADSNNPVSVQHPFPVNGDRVYAKDVDPANSDITDFTGVVTDLFDNYLSTNVAASVGGGGVNPKTISIMLNSPVETSVVGFGSSDTSLSNGKLILKGLDGQVLGTPVDQSADSTKRGVMFFPFEQTTFIEMVLELYTDDEVTINGSWIPKSRRVTVGAIDGLIPPEAQTTTPLIANAEWISETYDTKNYVWILVSVQSDVASAEDGFKIEFCVDKSFDADKTWDSPFTVGAGKKKTFSDQPAAQYMRVRYKNGVTGQASIALTTQLKPVPSKPSSHRLVDNLDGQDDAELVMSQLLGLSELTGEHENVGTFRRALKVDAALVHKVGVNELFRQLTGVTTTLAVASLADDFAVDLVSVVGLTDVAPGSQIEINGERYHFHVTDITGTVVTLDRRLDSPHAIGAVVNEITTAMNVDGTLAAPEIFTVNPPPGEIWQITRIITSITDGTAMDDGKFGGGGELPNGVILRANRNGQFATGTIWKTNGDMALDQYDLVYTDKAPAGENGLRGRWTFTKAEFIVELDGDTNDYLAVYVQDPISTQTSFQIKAQGRVFGG